MKTVEEQEKSGNYTAIDTNGALLSVSKKDHTIIYFCSVYFQFAFPEKKKKKKKINSPKQQK